MNILVNNLINFKLFENMTSEEIEKLINSVNYKKIKLLKNEFIFDAYSDTNYIGLILYGNINIEKLLPCGKSVLMYAKKKGDIFGEVAVFSETSSYPCNAIATDKTSLLLFYKSDFFKLLIISSTVLENFLKLVCNKAFYLNTRVGSLSFSSAKQKIAQSLLYDFNINDSLCIKLPFSKKVWADNLNISRASLYRELDNLCNASIISFYKLNIINILDINNLNNIILN